jgi:hypothetical protein
MQKGQIFRRHGAWHLRYRTNGQQVSVKLTDYSVEYRTLTSVRPLAERHLQPVNQGLAPLISKFRISLRSELG